MRLTSERPTLRQAQGRLGGLTSVSIKYLSNASRLFITSVVFADCGLWIADWLSSSKHRLHLSLVESDRITIRHILRLRRGADMHF